VGSWGQKETLGRVRLEVVKKIVFPIMPWDTLIYIYIGFSDLTLYSQCNLGSSDISNAMKLSAVQFFLFSAPTLVLKPAT